MGRLIKIYALMGSIMYVQILGMIKLATFGRTMDMQ
jgi:hypothetical protein